MRPRISPPPNQPFYSGVFPLWIAFPLLFLVLELGRQQVIKRANVDQLVGSGWGMAKEEERSLLFGQSMSVNTTGKMIQRSSNDHVPSWARSEAVKAFRDTVHTRHHLHWRMYLAIFLLSLLGILIWVPWRYEWSTISSDAARTTGSSVILGVHQLSVMITTFIALAIPLTASFYTRRCILCIGACQRCNKGQGSPSSRYLPQGPR